MSSNLTKNKSSSSSANNKPTTDLDATALTAADTFRETFSAEDVETGVGIPSSAVNIGIGNGSNGGGHIANSNSNDSRSRPSSRPRWILAGTIGILCIVGLAVGLTSNRSSASSPAVEVEGPTTTIVGEDASLIDDKNVEVAIDDESEAVNADNESEDGGAGNDETEDFGFVAFPSIGDGSISSADNSDDNQTNNNNSQANNNNNNSDSDTIPSFKPEVTIDNSALLNPNFPTIIEEPIEENVATATTTATVTSSTSSSTLAPSSSPTKSTTATIALTEPLELEPEATFEPTKMPTSQPTKIPTNEPTTSPSASPSNKPSSEPTNPPSPAPTSQPTKQPIIQPALYQAFLSGNFQMATPPPTAFPTKMPTNQPTSQPTNFPTPNPTNRPTPDPDQQPALYQAFLSGNWQTQMPSPKPTQMPTSQPTSFPTHQPSNQPTPNPTPIPTPKPVTQNPTPSPTPANPYYMGDEFYIFDEDGVTIKVSKGLSVRLLARTFQKVQYANGDKSDKAWHRKTDAAGIIPECPDRPTECGYAYASNSEVGDGDGGVYGLFFNKDGEIIEYKPLLTGTSRNCGGGISPWHTWISCEETDGGQCWQVDPYTGDAKETELGGNGGEFESVAVDNRNPDFPVFFTTEDEDDGALRRFVAQGKGWDALHTKGEHSYLNILSDNTFEWTDKLETGRESALKYYPKTEGIQFHDGSLYFMAKELKRMLILDLDSGTYTTEDTGKKFYGEGDFGEQPDQNLFGATRKYLYFTEDGGTKPGVYARFGTDGTYFTMFEADLDEEDETVGIALSPDHKRFYAGIQDLGYIYEFTRDDGLPFE